jgi:anionic cell wall polymer biosynthesis LytR-Cps2A-Psr (LCP) family protein
VALRRLNTTAVLLVLVFLVIIVTGGILYVQLRTDDVSSRLVTGEVVRTLVIAHEEDDPFLSFVLFYHPETDRAAVLDIPGNLGGVIRSLSRVDRIDAVFDHESPDLFRAEVEQFIGASIPFTLVMSERQLIDFIDLLGGVDLFIINDYRELDGNDPILLPTGNVRLDGQKAVQYVRHEDEVETELERIGKRQAFVQSLLRSVRRNARFLTHPNVVEVRSDLVETRLDNRAQTTLFSAFGRIDPERIVRRRVQGTTRAVEVEGVMHQLLFPHFEGQWLKQAVQQVEQTLASTEEEMTEQVVVSLEILNGTTRSGLARRTAELYEDYGFEIRRFGNAESDQIEHTLIVDRRGIGDLAQQTAQVIRGQREVTEVQPAADVEVTVILGRDFDGSVVRTQ